MPHAYRGVICNIPKASSKGIRLSSAYCKEIVQLNESPAKGLSEDALDDAFEMTALTRPLDVRREIFFPDKRLLQFDCGKLQQLDILLRRLKAGGHKALIFTQMSKMLDILEEFLNFYSYTYVRLDGTTRVDQRQALMEQFNHSNKIFLFILSTRSGGFGINLTGADSVIFYDSDWNPAMDLQAQDRAHRIGQTREVHIYRLISEHTIEENILKKSRQKQHLDSLVMKDGAFTPDFFKKLDVMELFQGDKNADAAMKERANEDAKGDKDGDDVESAMLATEDQDDQSAMASAKAELNEGELEFERKGGDDEEEKAEEPLGEDKARQEAEDAVGASLLGSENVDDGEAIKEVKLLAEAGRGGAKSDLMKAIEDALKPVERYALRYIETQCADVAEEQLNAIDQRAHIEEQEWKMDELMRLREQEEEQMDDDDEPLFYEVSETSVDAYREQIAILRAQGLLEAQYELYAPPDPKSQDVYAHPADSHEEEVAGYLGIRPPQNVLPSLRDKKKVRRKGRRVVDDDEDDEDDLKHGERGRRESHGDRRGEDLYKRMNEHGGHMGVHVSRGNMLNRQHLKRTPFSDQSRPIRDRKKRRIDGSDYSDEELDRGIVEVDEHTGFRKNSIFTDPQLPRRPPVDMSDGIGGLFVLAKPVRAPMQRKPSRRMIQPKKEERRSLKLDPAWTAEEDYALDQAVVQYGENWLLVADLVNLNPKVLKRRRWTADECKEHYLLKEEGARTPAACKPWLFIEAIIQAVQKHSSQRLEDKIIDEKRAAQPPRLPYQNPAVSMPMGMAGVPVSMATNIQHNMGIQTAMPGTQAGQMAAMPGQISGVQTQRIVSLEQAGSMIGEKDPMQVIALKTSRESAGVAAAAAGSSAGMPQMKQHMMQGAQVPAGTMGQITQQVMGAQQAQIQGTTISSAVAGRSVAAPAYQTPVVGSVPQLAAYPAQQYTQAQLTQAHAQAQAQAQAVQAQAQARAQAHAQAQAQAVQAQVPVQAQVQPQTANRAVQQQQQQQQQPHPQ